MKTTNELLYTKMLSDEDIVVHARIIAEASHEIREIEESKRKLRDLKATIERHSKYIQEGKIELQTTAEFEWHTPIADQVTVISITGDFRDFVRPMTEEELKVHCQLEIPFEEKAEVVELPTTAGESIPLNPDDYYIEGSHATWFVKRKGQTPCIAFFNDEHSCKLFLKHYLATSSLNQASDLMREDKAAERRAQLESIRNQTDEDIDPRAVVGVEDETYTIGPSDNENFPWRIIKNESGKKETFELFRTEADAKTFLDLYRANKIPENTPGATFKMEKGLGGWKVKKHEYVNGVQVSSIFYSMEVSYFDAKKKCDDENERYQNDESLS